MQAAAPVSFLHHSETQHIKLNENAALKMPKPFFQDPTQVPFDDAWQRQPHIGLFH